MHTKPDYPDIQILFPVESPYYRLKCVCGSYDHMIVQDGMFLKGNTQIMSVQCSDCGDIHIFHKECTDQWREVN